MSDLPRVRLLESHDLPLDFEYIATYAHGVGPNTEYIMHWPYMTNPEWFDPTTVSAFVIAMHKLDMEVHTYKHAQDELQYMEHPHEETALYFIKRCDGVFTE